MLIIFGQAPIETKPSEGALDDPCKPSNFEGTLLALDDPKLPAVAPELGGELAAVVASIRNNCSDGRRKRRLASKQSGAGDRVDPVWARKVPSGRLRSSTPRP